MKSEMNLEDLSELMSFLDPAVPCQEVFGSIGMGYECEDRYELGPIFLDI